MVTWLVALVLAYWVFRDARKRGADLNVAVPWTLVVLGFSLFGWLAYLIFRPEGSAASSVSISDAQAAQERRYAAATHAIPVIAAVELAPCVFLLAVVVPKYREIFASLGGELPPMTAGLLWLSAHWWLSVALLALPLVLFVKHPAVRQWFLRRAPWSYVVAGVVPTGLGILLIIGIVAALFVPIFQQTAGR